MTCEALCMNRLGLAIAVDSAVSLGPTGRSYPSAEKLFALQHGAPVAIAVYGSASLAGVPWSLILQTFLAELGDRRFPTLEGYQQALVAFCESSHPLFSRQQEADGFTQTVSAVWRYHLRQVFQRHGEDTRRWATEAWDAVREVLREMEAGWAAGPTEGLQPAFGEAVLEAFAPQVEELRTYWFDGQPLPDDVWAGLRASIGQLYARDATPLEQATGIVFLGYGEAEYYPRFLELGVGARILERLRWQPIDACAIDVHDRTALVHVFAQPDMGDAFILGIPRRMRQPLRERVEAAAQAVLTKAQVPEAVLATLDVREEVAAAADGFFQQLHEEFRAPVMEAVAALPPRELAGLSRTLVSLAAFRSQLSVDDNGSVGGEIRVAVLTKHGGVQWAG
jgi:hypothetical protein